MSKNDFKIEASELYFDKVPYLIPKNCFSVDTICPNQKKKNFANKNRNLLTFLGRRIINYPNVLSHYR